ncbi:transmembrane protein 272-like [Cololabis saira]|uniref:transmembrane protein 272-like n=1 Tax=Cololabis saira TaxID=129043 RepID=UPI002AD2E16D|nr:transmembrane protein 272-like [Cololabis saira]
MACGLIHELTTVISQDKSQSSPQWQTYEKRSQQETQRSQTQPEVKVISKSICCILPIAHIAIGAVYLHDCPREPYIPIYLIVFGVFGVLLSVLPCLPCTELPRDGPATSMSNLGFALNFLMSIFLLCWFIAGNVWIYSIYQPNYDKNTTSVDPYCDKTLYLFSFWIPTLVYIFLGLAQIFSLCASMYNCMYACMRAICGLCPGTSSTTITTTTSRTITTVS